MFWLFLILASPAFGQILDLSALRALEEKLPEYGVKRPQESDLDKSRQERRFRPPTRIVKFTEIQKSGSELGSVKRGAALKRISDNQLYSLGKPIYLRSYRLPDEHGYKYLINQDGTTTFKMKGEYIESIEPELVLYVPPHKYTPAPLNQLKAEYDSKLSLKPEISFYTGVVNGDFMADLFNDPKARSGTTNQYGAHLFAEWDLPVKAGVVVHYEQSNYSLSGGSISYSSLSFGPQLKTRDFLAEFPLRFQTQFRISPLARAIAETDDGAIDFKFNSADFLNSLEHPIKNGWGEFVIGVFFQTQWLNLKDQPEIVSVKASNELNQAVGINFSQVFQ
jgi:hypothetical protein